MFLTPCAATRDIGDDWACDAIKPQPAWANTPLPPVPGCFRPTSRVGGHALQGVCVGDKVQLGCFGGAAGKPRASPKQNRLQLPYFIFLDFIAFTFLPSDLPSHFISLHFLTITFVSIHPDPEHPPRPSEAHPLAQPGCGDGGPRASPALGGAGCGRGAARGGAERGRCPLHILSGRRRRVPLPPAPLRSAPPRPRTPRPGPGATNMATPSSGGARRAAPLPRRLLPLLLPLLLLPAAAGGHSALLLRAPRPAPAAQTPRSRRDATRPPEPIQVYGQVSRTPGGGRDGTRGGRTRRCGAAPPFAPENTRYITPERRFPPPGGEDLGYQPRRHPPARPRVACVPAPRCQCREWGAGPTASGTAAPRASAAGLGGLRVCLRVCVYAHTCCWENNFQACRGRSGSRAGMAGIPSAPGGDAGCWRSSPGSV